MTAKFLTVIALVAFGLTSWSQQTNSTDVYGAASSQSVTIPALANAGTINGRTLFLRNCAHCHGATAHGDDGPDLHDLGLADDWIANRIRKGKAGQMTAFAGKLQPAEIAALVAYIQSLKRTNQESFEKNIEMDFCRARRGFCLVGTHESAAHKSAGHSRYDGQ